MTHSRSPGSLKTLAVFVREPLIETLSTSLAKFQPVPPTMMRVMVLACGSSVSRLKVLGTQTPG